MNSSYLLALANHLWQSTLFAVVVGCLTLLLRKNNARVRYLLWLAASAKFLLPFALLTAVGAQIPWPLRPVHTIEPSFFSLSGQPAVHIAQFGGQGAAVVAHVPYARNSGDVVLIALGVLWALGTLLVAARWFAQVRLVWRARRESTATSLAFVIPVRSSSSQLEPAVVGVLRPVLLLPKDIEHRLISEEMRAVLAHERCHVIWRDNLAAALHMLAEALFWFHPLIWWLGTRIVIERERACDERVLAEGHPPGSYAEGILKVCEYYLNSRLACAAGVSGADLKRRIQDIMENQPSCPLSRFRKLLLAAAAASSIAVPLVAGLGTSPAVQAQSAASTGHEVGDIVLIKSGGLTYIKADGLIWTFPSHRAYWADANSYCTQSTIDGQLGWRLPNAAELERLYARHANALPPDWAGDYVWSATVAISDDPDPHASYHVVAIRSGGSGQMKDDSYRGVVTCVHDPDPPGEGLPPRVAPPGALP